MVYSEDQHRRESQSQPTVQPTGLLKAEDFLERFPIRPDDPEIVVELYRSDDQQRKIVRVAEIKAKMLPDGSSCWLQLQEFGAESDVITALWDGLMLCLDTVGVTSIPFGPEAARQPRGPNDATRLRAEAFRKIKDKHPTWGYATVAQSASEELKDTTITESTVRNAYRAMGWHWVRADRVHEIPGVRLAVE